ncbi:sporulation membrane protein YtaF [Alicyclobacillus sp.]|uniref:sporulation membrane protein YtaF n=1 Tax=Alicyclobacillus sp. TaxID=61169 RepID=UPI0025C4C6E1|nr:sporulation membrane protein YtaF [Alicyclobacillus sp.]
MRQLLLVLGFSVSSSLDNFGVGISYGVNQIRIGRAANLLIAAIAFAFSMVGMAFGSYMTHVVPGPASTLLGALLILIIGLRIVLIATAQRRRQQNTGITRYVDHPEEADMDHSGEISLWEAAGLGVAVSANALTNGLGAGVMHLPMLVISGLTAVFSYLAIASGVRLGERVAHVRIGRLSLGEFGTVISGVILLMIAVHMMLSLF